jgi:hypothetical protein
MNGELARLRETLPEGMKHLTQFVLDNPVPVGVTAAGAVVMVRIGSNVVRPRTAVQASALAVVLYFVTPWLLRKAIERGVISFKFRDGEGGFVSARELMDSLREDPVNETRADPAG